MLVLYHTYSNDVRDVFQVIPSTLDIASFSLLDESSQNEKIPNQSPILGRLSPISRGTIKTGLFFKKRFQKKKINIIVSRSAQNLIYEK